MGWNGSDNHLKNEPSIKKTRGNISTIESSLIRITPYAIGLIIAVIITIGGAYLFSSDENKNGNAQNPTNNEESYTVSKVQEPQNKTEQVTNTTSKLVNKLSISSNIEPQIVKTITNSNGAVIQDLIMPDGKTKRIVRPPKPIWDNAADQLIAFAISIEPGVDAPPLPTGVSNDEFRRALKKNIVINPDDSEEVKKIKRRVRDARREILEIMDSTGKSFEEVLNDHHAQMNQNSALYHEALRGLTDIEKNGSPEEIALYIEKSNELLRSQGARELPIREFQNQENTTEEKR